MSGEYPGLESLVNNSQSWPIDAVIGDNIEVVRETIKRRIDQLKQLGGQGHIFQDHLGDIIG